MSPYYGANFFEFFRVLATRLFGGGELASDEVQLLVLMGVAISAALVGSFLVLRKMVMIANSISHTILLGIVVVYLIAGPGSPVAMLIAAVVTGVLTSMLTELVHKGFKLQEDAANGLVFTTLFAVAILLVSLYARNLHLGAEVVMGSVDGLHLGDLKLVYAILVGNLALFAIFYRAYKVTTFDPGFARSIGVSTVFFNYLLMTQASATIVGAFRAVGVLMVLAFLVAPPLTARLMTNRLGPMLGLASVVGCVATLLGVATARHLLSVYDLPLSTGGLVVCYLVTIYASVATIKRVYLRATTSVGIVKRKNIPT